MRPIAVFGCTAFLVLCLISDCRHSEAAGRTACQAGKCEAPILIQAPDATRSVCPSCPLQRVEGQPLRNAGRAVIAAPARAAAWFQERRPVRRALAAPFRWLRGCN